MQANCLSMSADRRAHGRVSLPLSRPEQIRAAALGRAHGRVSLSAAIKDTQAWPCGLQAKMSHRVGRL